MAYLDDTGLAYFWGKIKAWAQGLFALVGHTHPSSDVTLMTGYSKPSSGSAIAASDSLNQAVGKLEAKVDASLDDSNYVHKTGSEEIAGSKTFTNPTVAIATPYHAQLSLTVFADDDSTKRRVWLRNDGDDFWILHSDAGDTSAWNNIRTYYNFSGKRWIAEDSRLVFRNRTFKASTGCPDTDNGLSITNWDANTDATHAIIFHRNTAGSTTMYLRVHQTLRPSNYADIGLRVDENGNASSWCPAPDATSNNQAIATTAWVRTFCNTTFVTLDGTQTITGAKTFNSEVKVNNAVSVHNNSYYIVSSTSAARYFVCKFTNLARYDSYNTSSSSYLCIGVQANNGNIPVNCYYEIQSDGSVRCLMRHNHYSTTTNSQFIFYSYKGKGEGYVTCSIDNKYRLGIPDHRWSAVYAATASIQTSDERLKVDVVPVPDAVLDVWEGVEWKQFKFTDSVEEKGLDGARLHAGAVAQSIGRAFAAAGLDASRYGFYCYDSWEAKAATYDDMGQIFDAAQEAGDRYSLRYEEVLCIEAAYMRRENARLKKRVADLEERLAALELKVS